MNAFRIPNNLHNSSSEESIGNKKLPSNLIYKLANPTHFILVFLRTDFPLTRISVASDFCQSKSLRNMPLGTSNSTSGRNNSIHPFPHWSLSLIQRRTEGLVNYWVNILFLGIYNWKWRKSKNNIDWLW